jgi:hypothetical protein
MSVTRHSGRNGTALGLLEIEDQDLRDLFTTLQRISGSSLEVRSAHGQIAKDVVRHLASREGPDRLRGHPRGDSSLHEASRASAAGGSESPGSVP